nr:NAD(P)H-binding protein [Blastococcus saxobsidens]
MVTGASGFVGSRLATALEEAGHEVRAMTRRPERYQGAGTPVAGDVGDEASLRRAMEGCEVAYYLVHSLDDPDFERKDAAAARTFAGAAAAAGVQRIVYLGGLGRDGDQLSRHLRSRREVERLLGGTGVPVTVLRAGIVVGHGGVSWEMTRQLVAHLPAMVTPRWVSTRTQPIAVADVVRYLVGVLDAPQAAGRVFEVGGPEVLSYLQMMIRVAEIQNRHMFVVPVPLLSPQLSSRWLALVTDVDAATGRSLIDSMTNEVVVTDDAIRSVVPFDPMDYDEMVMTALVERARERRQQAGERRGGWLSRGARR